MTSPNPNEVLQRTRAAYAAFKNFRCEGVLNRLIQTNEEIRSVFGIELAFARPDKLFFQWWRVGKPTRQHHVVIASDGMVTDHSFADISWTREQDIKDVLARHAGISFGLSLFLPSLLLPIPDFDLLKSVLDLELTSADRESYALTARCSDGVVRNLKIRTRDFVILEFGEKYSTAGRTVEAQSTYSEVIYDV